METFRYLDPEKFWSSLFTDIGDVYCSGKVTVELLTGQNSEFIIKGARGKRPSGMFDQYDGGKLAPCLSMLKFWNRASEKRLLLLPILQEDAWIWMEGNGLGIRKSSHPSESQENEDDDISVVGRLHLKVVMQLLHVRNQKKCWCNRWFSTNWYIHGENVN